MTLISSQTAIRQSAVRRGLGSLDQVASRMRGGVARRPVALEAADVAYAISPVTLVIANARVEDTVEDVGDQVEEDEGWIQLKK
jgi:hypothetical protein